MDDLRRDGALRALIRRLSAHSVLDAADKRAIMRLPVSFAAMKPHVDLVRVGATLNHSCLVEDGMIARYEQFVDGRRQILSLRVPGDFLDLSSLLLSPEPETLEAISESTIAKIPHAALRQAVVEQPSLGFSLWRDTAREVAIAGQALARIGRRDAYARVAHLLCEMAIRCAHIGDQDRPSYRFPITQEQLGDLLGLTSVHVNRTLKALREERLVEFGAGKVVIHDWSALQHAAEFDGTYLAAPDKSLARAIA